MSTNGRWKEELAARIVQEAKRLNIASQVENIWDTDGEVVQDTPLPGFDGSVVTAEELITVGTHTTGGELWWCRAIAAQKGLSITFMDWFYHSKKLLQSDK